MSIFTSPPSEAYTVLLWGHHWWLAGRTEPIAFAAPEEAAGLLVAALAGDGPRRLRLIYHPDGFRSVVTPCPHTDRTMLALALQEQFPALAGDEIAWSYDPILGVGDGFTTVLHCEPTAWLATLTAQLCHAGIEVVSAWPLATWLQALPAEWTDSGAATVLAVAGNHACAYHHPAGGRREVLVWPQAAVGSPQLWLANLLDRNPAEPVWLVTPEAQADCAWLPTDDHPGLHHVTLADALAQRVTLATSHPAQLLPPLPWVTASRAVLVASVALLAAAAGLVAPWAHAHAEAHHAARNRTTTEKAVAAEVSRLRANATEVVALRRELAARPSPWAGALLRRLAATVPSEVTLSRLEAEAGLWVARGFLAPTATGQVLERWRSALGTGEGRQAVTIDSPGKPEQPFQLRGASSA